MHQVLQAQEATVASTETVVTTKVRPVDNLTAVRNHAVDAYRGLAQRSPVLALSMLIFLLSLGGIPFVAGFWAKLFIFKAVFDQHMYGLALLGAVLTIVALYYYLVLASRMYIDQPEKPAPVVLAGPVFIAILICVVGVVGMGGLTDAACARYGRERLHVRAAACLNPSLQPHA